MWRFTDVRRPSEHPQSGHRLNQSFRASGLNPVIAAIVYWTTVYIERAVQQLRPTGGPTPDDVLAHVSPLGWEHISLTGDYLWGQTAQTRLDYWPLRLHDGILVATGGSFFRFVRVSLFWR
jgi:hypothetical protein